MYSFRLRTKLMIAFLAVSTVALAFSALLNLTLGYNALSEQARLALGSASSQTAATLDSFFQYNLNTIRTQSLLPDLIEYLELPANARAGSASEYRVTKILDSFLRRDHINISSYALFDQEGKRLLDTYGGRTLRTDRPAYFDDILRTGLPAVTPILMSRQSHAYSLFFSSPVRNPAGQILGILRVRYNATAIQRLVFEKEGLLGPGSLAILLDENQVRLADSHDSSSIWKPLTPLPSDLLAHMKEESRPFIQTNESEALSAFATGVREQSPSSTFTATLYPGSQERMLCSAKKMQTRPWIVVFAYPRSVFLGALRRQVLLTTFLLLAVMLAAMGIGLLMAQRLSRPIIGLTTVAGKIARGDFGERLKATGGDEIGELMETFNGMAQALQESQQKLQSYAERMATLLDTIPDVVFRHLPDGTIVDVNQRCTDIYGYSREELLTRNVAQLSGEGYTQDRAEMLVAQAAREGRLDFEWVARKKDGLEFPVLVRLRRIMVAEEDQVIAVVTDIAERRMVENQLLQARKLEAIGTLAGGIAHDFNNLLMGIQSYISIMQLDTALPASQAEHLRHVEELVKSGAGLTRQLLGFARGGRYEIKALNVNDILSRTAETFGRTRREIAIHTLLADSLWTVEADTNQLEQVFLNLYVNAWQAMEGGGHLFIETENLAMDELEARAHQLQSGRYVRILIRDTGIGIDEETQNHIFEPFFTTKEVGHGTGLGLASAYGIVRSHGGAIKVTSRKGAGTTFSIFLPASEKTAEIPRITSPEIRRGKETILLVDDEDVVLRMCKTLLERLGYHVYAACCGKEALQLFREHRQEIDLVMLDMIMPEMGGGETFDALRGLEPDLKVMLSSGYSLNDQAREIMSRGCIAFIQKPFNTSELSQKLRRIFDAETSA